MTTEPKTTGDLNALLAAHFRGERAIAAARRWISQNTNEILRRSDVMVFLRRRRDRLSEAEIEHCATEALNRWLSSRANRYRGKAPTSASRP